MNAVAAVMAGSEGYPPLPLCHTSTKSTHRMTSTPQATTASEMGERHRLDHY